MFSLVTKYVFILENFNFFFSKLSWPVNNDSSKYWQFEAPKMFGLVPYIIWLKFGICCGLFSNDCLKLILFEKQSQKSVLIILVKTC